MVPTPQLQWARRSTLSAQPTHSLEKRHTTTSAVVHRPRRLKDPHFCPVPAALLSMPCRRPAPQAYFSKWPESGEVDLKKEFANLVAKTAARTLLGREIREQLFDQVSSFHALPVGATLLRRLLHAVMGMGRSDVELSCLCWLHWCMLAFCEAGAHHSIGYVWMSWHLHSSSTLPLCCLSFMWCCMHPTLNPLVRVAAG